MIDVASDGVVEFLFHDLDPGMSPVQVVAHNLKNNNYPHTYKSALVACDGDDLVGMALFYPSSYHKITNGFNILSLIVFTDNSSAIQVYKKTGFEIVGEVELRSNEFIKHNTGCFLMKCEITT